jgi:autotransporter-associated beta strand protein
MGRRLLLERVEERLLLSGMDAHHVIFGTLGHVGSYSSAPWSPAAVGNPAAAVGTAAPFNPAQIRAVYGLSSISGDGTGQTILIIDAYEDPNIEADLATFDSNFGLPAPPSFIKVNQNGGSDLSAVPASGTSGWATEIALDVEWAHAMAPGANIILMETNSTSFADILTAPMTALKTAPSLQNVSVVSMSFGQPEFSGESSYDSLFVTPSGHRNVTFLASTGDNGSPGCYPAYSPNVVAVGGTSLTINGDNIYGGETGWSGSGGGQSKKVFGHYLETEPSYQNSVQSSGARQTPDVSFDADVHTGVYMYDSYPPDVTANGAAWLMAGGTSLAAPCWAGLIAVADGLRYDQGLSTLDGRQQTLPTLYSLPSADFHDITSGSNGGFSATTGYDMVTGIGTPVANYLVPDLVGPASSGLAITPNSTSTAPAIAATVASGGHSNVAAAEYFVDTVGNNGAGTALSGTFGSLTVNTSATLGTAVFNGLGQGTHTVYVHGKNAAGVWGPTSSLTFIKDTSGPATSGLAVSQALAGAAPNVSAAVNDTLTNVAAAEYFIDAVGASGSGGPLSGAFTSTTVNVSGMIAAAAFNALNQGSHTVYVHGKDAAGNWGSTVSTAFVKDTVPPTASNLAVTPSLTNSAPSVSASLSDAAGGGSNIVAAEYFIDSAGPGGSGTSLAGSFGSPTVNVTGTMGASTFAALSDGTHTIYVQGEDAAGNWSAPVSAAFVRDTAGPATTGLSISPSPANVAPSISASVSDVASGGSNLIAAEYFIDALGAAGAGTALSSSFGSPTATVSGTLDASVFAALTQGTHTVYVRGEDAAGNWGAAVSGTLVKDTFAPVLLANFLITSDTSPQLDGAVDDPTATVSVTVGGQTYLAINNSDGTWTLPQGTVPTLSPATYQVQVSGTDTAGNTGIWSLPDALVVAAPGEGGMIKATGTDTPLVIDGTGSHERLTVDFSYGNPLPPGGLIFEGGAQALGDTLVIVGTPATDTVTIAPYQAPGSASAAIRYSNVQYLSFDLDSGTADFNGTTQNLAGLTLASGNLVDGSVSASSVTLESGSVDVSLVGTGSLTKSGDGTVTLSGTSTYSGATTISAGTLIVASADALPVGTQPVINPAAELVFQYNISHAMVLTWPMSSPAAANPQSLADKVFASYGL